MNIFMLLIFLISSTASALPCPNGGGILYKGDSIEAVVKECGQPTTRKTTTQIISSSQVLIYYQRHAFDYGYSEIDFYFYDDRVSRIRVTDFQPYPFYLCQRNAIQIGQLTTFQTSCGNWTYEPQFTSLCGGFLIGVGDSIGRVEYICGPPASKNLQQTTNEITEFTYGTDSPQTIIFQNNKLLDWRN